jgi:hypothetical protein
MVRVAMSSPSERESATPMEPAMKMGTDIK